MPWAADVLLPLPLAPLRWLLPYGRPRGAVGARMVVPWQGAVRAGIVTGLEEVAAARAMELKEALDWLDAAPHLPPATVAWLLEEAGRSAAPPGVVLASLGLPGLRLPLRHRVRTLDQDAPAAGSWQDAAALDPERRDLLRDQGLLDERVEIATPTRTVLRPGRTPQEGELDGASRARQRAALAQLRADGEAESAAALARAAGVPDASVRGLVAKGLATYEDRPYPPAAPAAPPPPVPWPEGPDGPDAPSEETWLRIGGGTRAARLRALLPALRAELAAGRSPMLLAPERRVAEEAAGWLANEVDTVLPRASDDDRVRLATDEMARDGAPRVWLGTWPTLGVPLARPGRLSLLEAGNDAYKLRGHARTWVPEAAVSWADAHGVAMACLDPLLGPEASALGGGQGRRITLAPPPVRWRTTDLARTHAWPLSDDLIRVLRQVQARERQAVLLVPRRGYSAALGCRDCGAVVMCPNCDLALRWHAHDGRLRCHQCGHDQGAPARCPSCGGVDLDAQRAAGAEWVLRAVREALPALSAYRWDADVRDDLAPLQGGAPGVVVGTTALLRLAPLPVLSLIGVTQIDGTLHADDFRADERALRTLLTLGEVAGRRAPLGLIQTFAPEHPVLAALEAGEAAAIEAQTDAMDARRRRFGYPPHGFLARVQFSARRQEAAWAAARTARDRLALEGATPEELLGPAAAPVARMRGRSWVQLLLRTDSDARRRALLASGFDQGLKGARVRVEVDPRDIGEVLE
ncbi:MAG: hypothetical protein U5K81_08425 [Trueperaceae bacterium]|nr:hypothetical protein [Trueperaceae bacterium]